LVFVVFFAVVFSFVEHLDDDVAGGGVYLAVQGVVEEHVRVFFVREDVVVYHVLN